MSSKFLAAFFLHLALIAQFNYEFVSAGNDHRTREEKQRELSSLQNIQNFGTWKFAKWCEQVLDTTRDWYEMLPLYSSPTIFNEKSGMSDIDSLVEDILVSLYDIRDTLITNGNIHALVASWIVKKPAPAVDYDGNAPASVEVWDDKRRKRDAAGMDLNERLDQVDLLENARLLKMKEEEERTLAFNPIRTAYPTGTFDWEEEKDIGTAKTYLMAWIGVVKEFLARQTKKQLPMQPNALDELVEANALITPKQMIAYNRNVRGKKINFSDVGLLVSFLNGYTKTLNTIKSEMAERSKQQKPAKMENAAAADSGKEAELAKEYNELAMKCTLIVQVLHAKSKGDAMKYEAELGKTLNASAAMAHRNTHNERERILMGIENEMNQTEKRGYQKPKRNGKKAGGGGGRGRA